MRHTTFALLLLGFVYASTQSQQNNSADAADTVVVKSKPSDVLVDKAAVASQYGNARLRVPLGVTKMAPKVSGLELVPAEQTIPVTKRVAIVTFQASDPKLKVGWFITHDKQDQPIEYFEIPGLPFILVFPNAVEETIRVYGYTAINGEPVMVSATIIVQGSSTVPSPKPDPTPAPIPEPKPDTPKQQPVPTPTPPPIMPLAAGSQVNFIIVHDNEAEKNDPKLADLVTSIDLMKGLSQRKHFRWVLDATADAEKIRKYSYEPYVKAVGKMPVYLVLDQHGNICYWAPLEGTAANILGLVDKIAPPR